MEKQRSAQVARKVLPTKIFVGPLFIFIISVAVSGVDVVRAQTRTSAAIDTPMIFDVRKSLPMEPTEPTFHDFYINAGSEVGLKKGQYVPVQRALPIHDPVQNKQQAVLTVSVGKILVIHVERNMAVARLVTELGDDERPTLEYESIMIGDRIDMKGITTEAPKNIKKKKSAFQPAPGPTVTAMVIEAAPLSVPATSAPPATSVPVATVPAVAPEASKPVKTESASQPSAPPRVTQTLPAPTA